MQKNAFLNLQLVWVARWLWALYKQEQTKKLLFNPPLISK